MNYAQHYVKLIKRAANRQLNCYYEKHHIIPKCMDGSDDKWNIVKLTAEEHFVAHLLLCKIHPNNDKLIYAASMMLKSRRYEKYINNKQYGWLKRKFANNLGADNIGKEVSWDTRIKISHANSGKKQSVECRNNMIETKKGKPLSDKHRRKISKTKLGTCLGENNGNSKLTNKIVKAIKRDLLLGLFSLRELGKKYKVNHLTIGNIANNKIWTHIII